MKTKDRRKRYTPLFLIGGMIATLIILSSLFDFPQIITLPLLIIFGLIFSSMALWAFANRNAEGSEWWQDDSASGWRGY